LDSRSKALIVTYPPFLGGWVEVNVVGKVGKRYRKAIKNGYKPLKIQRIFADGLLKCLVGFT
jgi:hypothetical protein